LTPSCRVVDDIPCDIAPVAALLSHSQSLSVYEHARSALAVEQSDKPGHKPIQRSFWVHFSQSMRTLPAKNPARVSLTRIQPIPDLVRYTCT